MEVKLLQLENTKNSSRTDSKTLPRDLKLETILDIIAGKDLYLKRLCSNILLNPSICKEEIIKRQAILKDGIHQPEVFFHIYTSASDALEKISGYDDIAKQKYSYIIPASKKILTQVEIAKIGLEYVKTICNCIHMKVVSSPVLSDFFKELLCFYDEDFFVSADRQLKALTVLKETDAIVVGGHLGGGLKLSEVMLHQILSEVPQKKAKKGFISLGKKETKVYEIKIENPTIENQVREITDSSLYWILKTINDLNHSVRYLLEQLRDQFGFYCGGINLYRWLLAKKVPVCFPEVNLCNTFTYTDLSDIFLWIKEGHATANSIAVKEKRNWIITGANQGGKTTFLRSLGIAQLMAQSGYIVAAKQYQCPLYQSIYTHFPEEEDTTLRHGLLEQELVKLNAIITHILPGSLLLLNESFATTTEYDANYLARQLFYGLSESGIVIFYVTHNYEFSHSFYTEQRQDTIFLRAQRTSEGLRTYKLSEGEPIKSGYAMDLCKDILIDH
jgi:hypothetical protein